jgi:hypothetical protein
MMVVTGSERDSALTGQKIITKKRKKRDEVIQDIANHNFLPAYCLQLLKFQSDVLSQQPAHATIGP